MAPIHTLKLPFAFDADRLRADVEAAAAVTPWRRHFNTNYFSGDWAGIALRANNDRLPLMANPAFTEWRDTAAMAACRYVPDVLAKFECTIEAIRFLRLAPGTIVLEHNDSQHSFEYGVARIHIPIVSPAEAEFILDDERLELAEGECWYVNVDLKHRLANNGDRDRVHLVIDVVVDDWLRKLFGSVSAQTSSE